MSTLITIQTTRSLDQKSITIVSNSYLENLTSVILNIYTNSLVTPIVSYTFDANELVAFVGNGSIDLVLKDIFGTDFIQDNWYITYLTGNDGDIVSNYDGFGVYTYVKTKVYEQINSLHTPEYAVSRMESLFLKKIFLEGLEYLDTSTILSRDIKFKKRLLVLTKMLE